MHISGRNNLYRNPVNEKFFAIKKLEKAEKEKKGSRTETMEKTYPELREDGLEISPEGRLAAVLEQEAREQADSGIEAREKQSASKEQEETEIAEKQDDPEVSEEQGGKVAVNVGKRMRQIAAAKSRGQLQQVLSLLQKDLSDCKAGLEKGWCDESEIAKVEALISKAEARMSQVPQESGQEKEQGGLDEFAMASLM